jgi:hypothetical protein
MEELEVSGAVVPENVAISLIVLARKLPKKLSKVVESGNDEVITEVLSKAVVESLVLAKKLSEVVDIGIDEVIKGVLSKAVDEFSVMATEILVEASLAKPGSLIVEELCDTGVVDVSKGGEVACGRSEVMLGILDSVITEPAVSIPGRNEIVDESVFPGEIVSTVVSLVERPGSVVVERGFDDVNVPIGVETVSTSVFVAVLVPKFVF